MSSLSRQVHLMPILLNAHRVTSSSTFCSDGCTLAQLDPVELLIQLVPMELVEGLEGLSPLPLG